MAKGGKAVLRSAARAAVIFLALAGTAWAADGGRKEDAVRLGDITVTANKMEEDLQKVPQSVTVISEAELEEKGIRNVIDVIREIPNMSGVTTGHHGSPVSFRGLNPSMFTNNNPVVVYIDGVPQSGKESFDASLANAERVEVLRGPQGSIYGKDAIGAVINIVTKKPENKWAGKIGAEYGSYNHMRGVFNAGGALLQDKLFLGINGQYDKDDGWIKNDYPGKDDDFNKKSDRRLNANLAFTPTDRFTARVSVTNDYNRNYGVDGYGLPSGAKLSDFSRDDAEHVKFDAPLRVFTESNAQSLALRYAFDSMALDSVTTHKTVHVNGKYDADFGAVPIHAGLIQFNKSNVRNWTQELRLSSNNEEGFRWVAGLYFEREHRKHGPYGQQFPFFDPGSGMPLGNFEMNAESITDTDTYAAFGQAVIPFAERFELTLGGRWQRIKKHMDLSTYLLPIGVPGPPMYELDTEKTWNAFLPKAALSFSINDDWTTYVSWSRGYMPGGFNYFATGGTASDNTFKPQVSTNYELGIKGVFERASLSAALFRMDIEDIHIYKSVSGTNIYLTDNAKKAHSQGVELEGMWRPFDGLELTGAAGLIQAKYDDYDWGGGNFNGENIETTPAHTLRAGVAYTHESGFYGRVDVTNQGRMYFYDDARKDFVKEDMYTVVDARAGYRFQDWDFYAYVRNLTDEEYVTNFIANNVLSLTNFGEPRTFGVGVIYHF